METVIFLGPSLESDAARKLLDADYRQPAAQGDIYRAVLNGPSLRAIGLIDGRFESVAAVRHKEILWALSRGVHVFGAASMGALRAAELADYGMEGVGKIFEAFRCGALEDDDELAVEHAPAAAGSVTLCDPMVNIRATLARARDETVISIGTHDRLIAIAKGMFYKHRTYASLVQQALSMNLPKEEIGALEDWLPRGRLNQKRDDAISMLIRIRDFAAADPAPFQPSFRFERSEAWLTEIEGEIDTARDAGSPAEISRADILDEVRLRPGEFARLRQDALTRILAIRELEHQGIPLTEADLRETERHLYERLGLGGRKAVQNWRAANQVDDENFRRILAVESALHRLTELASPLLEREMLNALRIAGRYPPLAGRALAKVRLATDLSLTTDEQHAQMPAFQLIMWYCSREGYGDQIAAADELACRLGFADLESFYRALRLEYELLANERTEVADD